MGFKFHHVSLVSCNNIRRAEQSVAFSFKLIFSHCCTTSCPPFQGKKRPKVDSQCAYLSILVSSRTCQTLSVQPRYRTQTCTCSAHSIVFIDAQEIIVELTLFGAFWSPFWSSCPLTLPSLPCYSGSMSPHCLAFFSEFHKKEFICFGSSKVAAV